MPPPHQLTVVRRFPACRIPISASGDELAPPKLAASPPPFRSAADGEDQDDAVYDEQSEKKRVKH